ncbi:unnamed protein product [Strongylus vulgaris]|uniref:Uncharacterized protein n=1 Tax=Strongylus vulgaris TaxID=40348 RepID=A0A3P7LJD6_STRVU|nr:unnamed protein product [Strongylus vulgaris]
MDLGTKGHVADSPWRLLMLCAYNARTAPPSLIFTPFSSSRAHQLPRNRLTGPNKVQEDGRRQQFHANLFLLVNTRVKPRYSH